MSSDAIWTIGLTSLAAFWLVILPYRLSKGIVHRLGYHAYCGDSCQTGLEANRVKAAMAEQFKKGMREGMRGAVSFGPETSKNMIAEHSALPAWPAKPDDSEYAQLAKKRYEALRIAFDVQDDYELVLNTLAIACGFVVQDATDKEIAFRHLTKIVSDTAMIEQEAQA